MIVDLIIVGLMVAVAVWGYFQGVSVGVLVFVGFGAGAVIGSRVAPLVLDGGLRDPFAPVLAVPAALLFGAVLAAALERLGRNLRRALRRRRTLDSFGGALTAACLGLVMVWMTAAVLAGVDGLKESFRDSVIVDRLNSVLVPPGPLLSAKEPSSALRVIEGPKVRAGIPDPRIKQDPQVRAAARSVAKIEVVACGGRGEGSGWVAADGIVVTNAHVARGSDAPAVRIEGQGKASIAEPIWYDDGDDIAILRTPALKGVPPLPIAGRPRAGTAAVVLGFPFGGRYKAREARLGPTSPLPEGAQQGAPRSITPLFAGLGIGPGSSGGPVIDRNGRVVAMIFAGRDPNGGRDAFGIPSPLIRDALRKALSSAQRVDTGDCREE
ncbi:MAG: MarP family serine protease [Thermoleophilaceae bacterium]|nr:MarP family serine protease [Thermoleophilaceae bacterium]